MNIDDQIKAYSKANSEIDIALKNPNNLSQETRESLIQQRSENDKFISLLKKMEKGKQPTQ